MTTYLPYRANVFCSLGHLIDGQFADTYLQQAGLIFCRGSIRLAGIVRPDVGTVVDFAYTRNNVTAARIPRRLRVLSSFADPFTKVTTVQLGCKLSLLQENREPDDKVTPLDSDPTLPTGWENHFAASISATAVAERCLTKLGITAADALPLTNAFTRDFIDLSTGYVEVLGKLLESETYVGWLNENEELEVRSLLGPDFALGPVINNTNCFTLSPIGVGSLPAEAVTVSYSALVLGDTSFTVGVSRTLGQASGWTGSISYGFPVPYEIAYGAGQKFTSSYIPVQETITEFSNSLMVRSTTYSSKPYAAAAGKYASQALTAGLAVPTTRVLSRSETVNRYDRNGQISETTQTETQSLIEFSGSLDLTFVFSPTDFVSIPEEGEVVIQRTITENSYSGNAVRREIQRFQNWSSTQNGQQAVNEGRQSFPGSAAVSDFINQLIGSLAYAGTEVTVTDSGAQQPQRLPGPAALTEKAYSGERSREKETLTQYIFGSVNSERNINFSLPYSGDDYYSVVSGVTFQRVRGSLLAKGKAINYGRVQNRLRLGNSQGVSLQIPVELLPTSPFDALYLQADGLTGQYRANGMSWTFDQNGIIGQVDALFWLAIGQTGTPGPIWFPMPPAVTVLPATPTPTVNGSPAPANSANVPGGWNPAAPDLTALFVALPTETAPVFPSTLNVGTGLEPFSETVTIEAITRSVLAVEELPYALTALVEDVDLVTTAVFDFAEVALVQVPLTTLTLAAQAPQILTPVAVPLTTLTLAAFAPTVTGSVGVDVPLTTFALTAFAPTVTPVTLWTPADISTALWLDASDSSTITTAGAAVSAWNDKSGNARHFEQATSGLQPAHTTAALNGLAVVDFAADYLTSTAATSTWTFLHDSTGSSVFCVAKAGTTSNPGATYGLAGTNQGSSGQIGYALYYNDDGINDAVSSLVGNGSSGNATIINDSANAWPANAYQVVAAVSDPNNGTAASRSFIYMNGNTALANNAFTNAVSTSAASHNLSIGAIGSAFSLTGGIAEFIIVSGIASTDTRQRIEGYLAHKWGLTAGLPGGHPYKTTAP